MSDTVKASDASHIPAPLRDWLDNAILAQMSDTPVIVNDTLARKTSIANAILYPLEDKKRRTKTARF